MSIYLKVPTTKELHYRQEWMKNPRTMSYNAGYDIDLKGYDKATGTITKTNEEMINWYNNWINQEPDKYFAYIYDDDISEPIGEVYYYLDNSIHNMGIVIQDKYRGKGYSYKALLELEKVAFEKNNISELADIIPLDRVSAIKTFKRAGFKETELAKKELVFGKESVGKQLIITKESYFTNKINLNKLIIRNAQKNDIEQIATIKVDGWRNAYSEIIDNEYLNNMSINKEINSYSNKYSLNDIYVAVLDNEVVGFCRVYNYDESEFEDSEIDCEIREIYVRPDIKRMGIGGKLFNFVLNHFKSNNKRKMYLGVFKDNYKSRNFYEKMGGTLWKSTYLVIEEVKYPIVSYLYKLN